jgi:nuclear GTP-binding protein
MPKGAVPTTAECLGADSLLQLLKNYVHSTGAKIAITVGVIGAPNVGKSSIINSLKRNKVAAVGNTPGVTTSVQQVHLDKHLRLLDSPGIVFSNRPDEAEGALRNYIKVLPQSGANI